MKKNKHVSLKLMQVIVPVIAIGIVGILLFLMVNANNLVISLAKNSLVEETEANANNVGIEINTFIGKLDTFAMSLEKFEFENDKELYNYLAEESTKFSPNAPNGVYLTLSDGAWLDPSGWMPDEDYVVEDRPWYQDGVKT